FASQNFQIPVWFFTFFAGIAIGTVRVTFFIAYLNIFGTLRWLRISAYIGGTFTALYHLVITVLVFGLITPARGRTWFSAITSTKYQHFLGILLPGHCVRLAIDMYILVLPLIAVSQIQMPTKKKISVSLIFLTGLILAEMFLGIIILCIPAAARSCRHHSEFYQHLKTAISSKVTGQGSASKALTPVSENGPVLDLDGMQNTWRNPYAHLEGPLTVIGSGSSHNVDEDGVRMTFEMTTTVQGKSVAQPRDPPILNRFENIDSPPLGN
ncbi:MAG: hypothetical protein Q9184_005832, partial [Pyrenodesmia sp. 2 TL-2023]